MPIPDDPWAQRRRLYWQVRALCVGLVSLSSGLIALYADASVPTLLLAAGVGLVLGVTLVTVAFPDAESVEPARSGRRRD